VESREFVDRLFLRLKVFSEKEMDSRYSSPPLQCLPLKPEEPGTNGL